jgi:hypothetical protein
VGLRNSAFAMPASWRNISFLALLALLSYFQYPGHIYLQSDTQIYVPMLQRFQDLSLYQRDPMVTRAHTAFTLYDELALAAWRATHLPLEGALGLLHAAARVALLAGIFLIARAAGLPDWPALACAGIYALGGFVRGPSVLLVEYEPVPRALAMGPLVLGIGLAAHGRYLAAGAAGAAAFLLHPTTAAPFWLLFGMAPFFPNPLRGSTPRLRDLAPLAAAAALLALGAMRQSGVSEPQALFGKIDQAWESVLRLRAPYLFVTLWPRAYFWQYGAMLPAAALAYRRLRGRMQPVLRFLLAGLALLGLISIPASYGLLEKLKLALIPQVQPLRSILFLQMETVLLSSLLAFELSLEKRTAAAFWWTATALAAGMEPRLLLLIVLPAAAWLNARRLRWAAVAGAAAIAWSRPFGLIAWSGKDREHLLAVLTLAWLLAAAAALAIRRRAAGNAALAAAAVFAFYLAPGKVQWHWSGEPKNPELAAASQWARAHTAGDAVFLFPDAEPGSFDPGIFRAHSRRALYVDWKSGGQANFFRGYSRIWWSRWRETMAQPFRPDRLPHFRELGIDYAVVKAKNRLAGFQPVFANKGYLIYRLDWLGKHP